MTKGSGVKLRPPLFVNFPPSKRGVAPLPLPLAKGEGLFITLTPGVPLSFEGEGEGTKKPLTTAEKRLDFDSGASAIYKMACRLAFTPQKAILRLSKVSYPKIAPRGLDKSAPAVIEYYYGKNN